MAEDFDPDAYLKQASLVVKEAPKKPTFAELTPEQRIEAIRSMMPKSANNPTGGHALDKRTTGDGGIFEPKSFAERLAAPAVGVSSAILPGVAPIIGGGIGGLAAGKTFSEGAREGMKEQAGIMSRHPWESAAGSLVGTAVSPLTKLMKGASVPIQALLGGAQGAWQGAGTSDGSVDDVNSRVKSGAILGAAMPLVGAAADKGAGRLANSKNRLIDMFAKRGASAMASNPESVPYTPSSGAPMIGGPAGPSHMPELKTSNFLRTPEEQNLAALQPEGAQLMVRSKKDLANGLPGMSRAQAATKQLVGPQHMNKTIGQMMADRQSENALLGGMQKARAHGGSRIELGSVKEDWLPAVKKSSEDPVSSIFSKITGNDPMHDIQASHETSLDLPFGPDRTAEISRTNQYRIPYENGEMNRFKEPRMVPYKNPVDAMRNNPEYNSPAPPTGPDVSTGSFDLSKNPPPEVTGGPPRMVLNSRFIEPGKPISQVKFSGFTPDEANLYGNAANRTQAINMGRDQGTTLSNMLAKGAAWTGMPKLAVGAKALGPTGLEAGAGMASMAGRGTKKVVDALDKYTAPNKTIAAFLGASVPDPDRDKEQPSY